MNILDVAKPAMHFEFECSMAGFKKVHPAVVHRNFPR